MGIQHGLAGQFGKTEASRRSARILLLALLSITLYVGIGAFVTGLLWHGGGGWVGLAIPVALVIAYRIGMKRLDQYVELITRERLKFLRGGQAEAYVAAILGKDLDNAWHIFNGVKLDNASDHDHVVVGPGGVFPVSTKSHRGWFVGSAAELRHNTRPCPFAIDARRQAAKLGERFKAVVGDGTPWVQAVLCVPFGYTDGDVFNGTVWLTHADDLTDRIAPEKAARKLTKGQLARAVKAMEMIRAGAADAHQRS